MKINFEGSLEEFHSVFNGMQRPRFTPSEFSTDADEEDEWGAGSALGPFTMPVPDLQPVPNGDVQGSRAGWEDKDPAGGLPVPQNDPLVGKKLDLPPIRPEQRAAAWDHFVGFCAKWVEGFGKTTLVPAGLVPRVDEQGEHVFDEEGNAVMDPQLNEEGNPVMVKVPVEQPDRLALVQELGQGRWPIPLLVMAYEEDGYRSLQRMVEAALIESGYDHDLTGEAWLDFVDQIAATMVQVSHMGFPDLAGTYDYSTRWRRS